MFLFGIIKENFKHSFQTHDELALLIDNGDLARLKPVLEKSMKTINDTLRLNVEIKYSFDIGTRYNETH